ncbi:hypothetical protein HJFPF1_05219 [Paramyrothecium foliicola]|nr:hypothetical protein HJFPF1_05219 [Paramyrothecium foliicola]
MAPRILSQVEEEAIEPVNIHDTATPIYSWMCVTCKHHTKITVDTCGTCGSARGGGDIAYNGKKKPIGRFCEEDWVRIWPQGTEEVLAAALGITRKAPMMTSRAADLEEDPAVDMGAAMGMRAKGPICALLGGVGSKIGAIIDGALQRLGDLGQGSEE